MFERQAAGVYRNSAAVIDADGSLLGVYRKMHIPDDPLFNEKYYFTPGDACWTSTARRRAMATGFRIWDTRYANVGVLICWDQWYPEAARITALLGADVLFYPTAIGWHPAEKAEWGTAQVEAWRTIQRTHAIANGVYVAVAQPRRPRGRAGHRRHRVLRALVHRRSLRPPRRRGGAGRAVLIPTCDPELIEYTRRNWPFLRDRRIDAYGPILKRYLGGVSDGEAPTRVAGRGPRGTGVQGRGSRVRVVCRRPRAESRAP